ncbi:MAG: Mut7-C RNAse domain-containing protein [Deltaproteobacteria bacterium]|nr:Mut7-C RNAse domain-containing protein [Deltaproteobacteria bacterium]
MESKSEIRFTAEMTLGKLAKWLRILGFDTVYAVNVTGEKLIDTASGRILLTRTKRIRNMKIAKECLFITSNHPFEQLREVVSLLGIAKEDMRPFSRCIRCNASIRSVEKNAVRGKVPDYIWETRDTFHTCIHCRRIYWSGSHIRRSRDIIKRLFK